MKQLGVLICLALAATCGRGASRHRHEARVSLDAPDYGDEPDSLDEAQLYQQRVTYDEEDSVAADNIKSVFGVSPQTQRSRSRGRTQTRPVTNPWSSRTVVRRTQVQPRAQQPCPQAHAARPNPAFRPPSLPYGGNSAFNWWPYLGAFPGIPVFFVPVPVCNCSTEGNENRIFDGRIGDMDSDYDDIVPAPLDFTPASTPRPLSFKPPKVAHTPSNEDEAQAPVQAQVTQRPAAAGGATPPRRRGEPRCARAIVNCCDLQVVVKCFEVFGCEGAFFGDPCSLYDNAVTVLEKYENRITQQN